MVCSEEQQSESGPLWGEASWILIGQALCSCGTPVYPLFITYVDDGVNNRAMGLYLGALFSTITIGSAMGYGIATLCLSLPSYLIYTDAYLPTSPDDPRWLGNWWLGFLIIGVLLFFVSIPLWFFPRFPRKTFVDEEEEDGDCKSDSSDDYVEAVTQGLKSLESEATHGFLHGLVLSVGRIVSNITVVCLILASTAIAGFIAGFQLFGAKYIQYEFSFDPDFASILFGLLLVPAGILGNIMGGYLVNRFAHERNDMAKMVVTCAAVCLILSPTLLFLGCKNNQVSCLTSLDDKNRYKCLFACDAFSRKQKQFTVDLLEYWTNAGEQISHR
ncbi:putative solute carrier organic anion transporter family member 1A4 [Apostichopus japonicus]|uniref:Putative solute carrier organic anion transporter family member 1A4 n=1 Tax=Stichopus japonicus TaxID=307972 RepID=A0A2G8LR07_STIJA|nr:putative solute carrier organic anion transporter family member 1A4 [Apostichopus japonicus]